MFKVDNKNTERRLTSFSCFLVATTNVATAKHVFSSVYVVGITCFDKCFLLHRKTNRYPEVLFNHHFFVQSRCNRGCLVLSDVFRRDFFYTT